MDTASALGSVGHGVWGQAAGVWGARYPPVEGQGPQAWYTVELRMGEVALFTAQHLRIQWLLGPWGWRLALRTLSCVMQVLPGAWWLPGDKVEKVQPPEGPTLCLRPVRARCCSQGRVCSQ